MLYTILYVTQEKWLSKYKFGLHQWTLLHKNNQKSKSMQQLNPEGSSPFMPLKQHAWYNYISYIIHILCLIWYFIYPYRKDSDSTFRKPGFSVINLLRVKIWQSKIFPILMLNIISSHISGVWEFHIGLAKSTFHVYQ